MEGIEKYSEIWERVRVAARNWGKNTGLHWKDELIMETFGWGTDKTTEEILKKFKRIKKMLRELRLKWLFGNCPHRDDNWEFKIGCNPLRTYEEKQLLNKDWILGDLHSNSLVIKTNRKRVRKLRNHSIWEVSVRTKIDSNQGNQKSKRNRTEEWSLNLNRRSHWYP